MNCATNAQRKWPASLITTALAALLGASVALALPLTNAVGGVLVRGGIEADAAASQTNALASLEWVEAGDRSADLTNAAGATLYLGHLDGIAAAITPTGVSPAVFDRYR